jgi:hypothetical protein
MGGGLTAAGAADEQLWLCRYVYAEYSMFAVAGRHGFGGLLAERIGGLGEVRGCWEEAGATSENRCRGVAEAGVVRRRVLVRLHTPVDSRHGLWVFCLDRDLGTDVVELEGFAFRSGYAGGFVSSCLARIENGGLKCGMTVYGNVWCEVAELESGGGCVCNW